MQNLWQREAQGLAGNAYGRAQILHALLTHSTHCSSVIAYLTDSVTAASRWTVWDTEVPMLRLTLLPLCISSSKSPAPACHCECPACTRAVPSMHVYGMLTLSTVLDVAAATEEACFICCRLLGYNTVRLPFRYRDLDQYWPKDYVGSAESCQGGTCCACHGL